MAQCAYSKVETFVDIMKQFKFFVKVHESKM